MRLAWLAVSLIPAVSLAATNDWKVGLGRIDITPAGPIWMAGYASRTHPSTGVTSRLWAKAMAIEDSRHHRVVIVTTDLIGLPRSITDEVSARVQKKWDVTRDGLLFNSSHTHTGPLIYGNLATMFDLDPDDGERVRLYSRTLADHLVAVIGAALGDLSPARLAYGFGRVGFAINRREPTPKGIKLGVNPNGPVDYTVPVLRVTSPEGRLRAILFAYACHNTTLTGEFYTISADYAGFAQAALESAHPGATAMFLLLCAGDQNPNPRSTLALAEQHGTELAASVDTVLASPLNRLAGPLRMVYKTTELNFEPHTRATFEQEAQSKNSAARRRARAMLRDYDEGHPIRHTPYPVQAIRFDRGLTLLALGGEVVIDYDLRVKREYGSRNPIIIAGYSNDVMSYIPSKRVLKEGGYEAVDSMMYYNQPGPYADDVEQRIFDAIHDVMARVGVKLPEHAGR